MFAVLFLIAFSVRMLTYGSIFVGNGDKVRFLEFDPFYHMRRVVSITENFPHIFNFDTYINYPYGASIGWGPLYDWTIAFVSYMLGLGDPSRHTMEVVGVYFPAFLGSLSVICIYFVAKEIFDNKNPDAVQIGFVSGLILAIIPAFVQVSFLGFVDHHVAEVLLSTTAFLFFMRVLKAEMLKERFKYIVLTIIFLILVMFTWPGTPIFVGIIVIYGIVQCAIDKRYKYLFVIIGILLTCYIGLYFVYNDYLEGLNSGIGFLIKDRIELQQVQETQPLFFTFSGKFTTEHSWNAFNIALYVALFGVILFIVNVIKNRICNYDKVDIFFLVWTLIVLILNLYQTRFVYLFAVNVAILCAYIVVGLINSGKRYINVLGFILAFLILAMSAQTINDMVKRPIMFSDDWFVALDWLKNNTPNPGSNGSVGSDGSVGGDNGDNGNWSLPSKNHIPTYGIMSWWDYGNYILYLSERPVVANNFQLGAEDSAKFYTSENDTYSYNILDDRRVKYVIVDYMLGMNIFREGGKENSKAYIKGSWVSAAFLVNKSINYYLDENNLPNEKYFNTTYAKLYLFNGHSSDGEELLDYKLVYQSKERYKDIFGNPIGEIKIFEYTGNTSNGY